MAQALNLNDVEEQRVEEFRKKHCGCIYYKVYPTGIGTKIVIACEGCIYYKVYPTGIGTKIVIVCEGCKAEEDISDYDCW